MPDRPWRDDEEDWSETDDADADDVDSDDSNPDDDQDDETSPCPDCGTEIYSDLDHCPRCGHWLTDADHEPRETGLFASRRVRLIAAVLLAIFVLSLIAELLLL